MSSRNSSPILRLCDHQLNPCEFIVLQQWSLCCLCQIVIHQGINHTSVNLVQIAWKIGLRARARKILEQHEISMVMKNGTHASAITYCALCRLRKACSCFLLLQTLYRQAIVLVEPFPAVPHFGFDLIFDPQCATRLRDPMYVFLVDFFLPFEVVGGFIREDYVYFPASIREWDCELAERQRTRTTRTQRVRNRGLCKGVKASKKNTFYCSILYTDHLLQICCEMPDGDLVIVSRLSVREQVFVHLTVVYFQEELIGLFRRQWMT